MTLSLSMGMSIGLKKTFYMMYGELLGVGLVATSSVIGVAYHYAYVSNYIYWF
ncbi:MAG: hypothetical protein U5K55_14565 [Aliarcobacter sp.]|nr:hypothetical protein [Aliarcobacter sp.]